MKSGVCILKRDKTRSRNERIKDERVLVSREQNHD
jgi:hypothetical protein